MEEMRSKERFELLQEIAKEMTAAFEKKQVAVTTEEVKVIIDLVEMEIHFQLGI